MNYMLPEARIKLCVQEGSPLYAESQISSPEDAVKLMRRHMQDLDREEVVVVNLDNINRPTSFHVVSIGSVNGSVVQVSNVFKAAILSNANKIMLFHNHPSGEVKPSQEDFELTDNVRQAGDVLGIQLLDHIIVGWNKYFSFLESGVLAN